MSGLVRSLGTLLVLIAVLAGAPAARGGPVPPATAIPAPLPATPAPCPPAWRSAAGPNPTWGSNQLQALAVVSADDVWAVGTASGVPLTAHWDGSAWRVVPVPATGLSNVTLYGAAAVGPHDIWAVGSGNTANGDEQTLVLHWDGSAWSRVLSPSPGAYYNELLGVAAVAANDVWAVGDAGSSLPIVIEHWNGSTWSIIPGPANASARLQAVAAVGPNDVWAVGDLGIIHWDGTTWREVPSPRIGDGPSILSSLAVVAADDIWAVGEYRGFSGYPTQLLAEHWDGTRWSIIPTPTFPVNITASLYGVVALATNDVWAVGGAAGTLALHWDGSAWRRVPSPGASAYDGRSLSAVAAVAPNDLWAVGSYYGGDDRDRTLVVHYSDTCAPPPAGCTLLFTDVAPGHPFYNNIQCLYCFNIVDGYGDGTFRPNNNVTRGQVAKLVTHAIGSFLLIPPDQQTFADVPPSHPFWRDIEQAYGAGLISGYSDGTFRPGNPMTRGQMAKFVSNAAGYADTIPPGQQTFHDVPPADPFWLFIERARAHGVIGGYSDGTFRPGASVTRGQAAKFISNAFFPGCGPLR